MLRLAAFGLTNGLTKQNNLIWTHL